ncbi:unnamed protein product [Boreogadus saida]
MGGVGWCLATVFSWLKYFFFCIFPFHRRRRKNKDEKATAALISCALASQTFQRVNTGCLVAAPLMCDDRNMETNGLVRSLHFSTEMCYGVQAG